VRESRSILTDKLERDRLWLEPDVCLGGGARKRQHYAQEAYFQEAYREFDDLFGQPGLAALRMRSFIVFKPDAAAARVIEPCLAALRRHGFCPISSQLFRFSRHLSRELWRYELNTSTYDRYPAVDALLEGRLGLFVALDWQGPEEIDDLSIALTAFKGPSAIERRLPTQLRTMIGAGDGMLNLIHTPDETLDILREIGVLFASVERAAALSALVIGNGGANVSDIDAFYAEVPPHSLSVDEIAARVAADDRGEFLLLATQAATALDFDTFRSELFATFPDCGEWDAITCFVTGRCCEVPGLLRVLAETSVQAAR